MIKNLIVLLIVFTSAVFAQKAEGTALVHIATVNGIDTILVATGEGIKEQPGYSTAEQLMTYRWLDNRPVYSKTFSVSGLAAYTTRDEVQEHLISHNITDIGNVVDIEYVVEGTSTTLMGNAWFGGNDEGTSVTNAVYYFNAAASDTEVRLRYTYNEVSYIHRVSVYYTKTSDNGSTPTAMVGIRDTLFETKLGDGLSELPAYAQTETLTPERWLDSTPIYRKVIDFGALPNNTTKVIAHGIANLGTVVNARMIRYGGSFLSASPIIGGTATNVLFAGHPYFDATNVTIRTTYDYTSYSSYVIVEYTKTTDNASSPVALVGNGDSVHDTVTISNGEGIKELPAYSTTEQVMPYRWLDNRPVYSKTFTYTGLVEVTNTDTYEVIALPHGITGIEKVIDVAHVVEGLTYDNFGGVVSGGNDNGGASATGVDWVSVLANETNISLRFTFNYSAYVHNITLYYTKTADDLNTPTALVGIRDTLYVNNYSPGYSALPEYDLSEVLTARRWVDGKPIYRKVVDFGTLPNSTSKDVAHGISNLGTMTLIHLVRQNGTNFSMAPTSNDAIFLQAPFLDATNVSVAANTDFSSYSAYVIIEYTKTTDNSSSPIAMVGSAVQRSKSIGAIPTPAAGDSLHVGYFAAEVTLDSMYFYLDHDVTGDATIQLYYADTKYDLTNTEVFAAPISVATPTWVTTFANATIPEGSWVWMRIVTVTDTANQLEAEIVYH